MESILWVVAAWIVVSVPVSLLAGAFMAGVRHADDLEAAPAAASVTDRAA